MKKNVILFSILIFFSVSAIGNAYAQVPEWVKNTAGWWSEGLIEDKDFLKGIEYLLNEEIIKISKVSANAEQSDKIPDWIKNNAMWWGEGKISEDDFLLSIEFLIKSGIIQIN